MTDPVTPKANRRVIDGDVVEDNNEQKIPFSAKGSEGSANANARRRAHNRTQQNTNASSTGHNGSRSGLMKPRLKSTLLWGGFLAITVALLVYTRPNVDWQIESINRLQVQVAQLHDANKQLMDQIDTQQKEQQTGLDELRTQLKAQEIQEAENAKLANQAGSQQGVMDQAQLEAIKIDTQQQLNSLYQQVQFDLSAFSQHTESQWQAVFEKAQSAITLSDSDLAKLSALEQKVEGRLTAVNQALAKLVALTEQPSAQAPTATEHKLVLEKATLLSPLEFKQWAVEINNQWLLRGEYAQTQMQLLALEQALTLSQLPNRTEFARVLGQDLSDIKTFSERAQAGRISADARLKRLSDWVKNIPAPVMQKASFQTESTESEKSTKPAENSDNGLTNNTLSMDKIVEKFSGLVSVKKREELTQLSSVEGFLVHDVLMQRLFLLVDRMQWAFKIQSSVEWNQAVSELSSFMATHFDQHSAAFNEVLMPLKGINFNYRQPLAVVNVNVG